MIYILENKINDDKSVFFALNSIYGIGKKSSFMICKKLGFVKNLKVKFLSNDQIKNLLIIIETLDLLINDDLRQFKILTTKRLASIKSYRGLRKIKGFPVRGQRTHTNGNTAKKIRY